MSAANHAAIFEVIWPSTVSDLRARIVSVWLVSGAADGIHVHPFSVWVQQLSEVSGAQTIQAPVVTRSQLFNSVALPTPPTLRRRALPVNGAKQSDKWLVVHC